jgi:hypothetical protein
MSYESAIVKLAEVIVGVGGQANIQFSNIPGTYRNLLLTFVGRGDSSSDNKQLYMQLNGDTGSNYDWQNSYNGSGELAQADSKAEVGYITGATAPSNAAGGGQILLNSYAGTSFRKLWSGTTHLHDHDTNAARTFSMVPSGSWRSTAAITSILLFPASGNFVQNSVASLYGIV